MPETKLTIDGFEVTYSERPGSPNETCSGDVFRARRVFDVPFPKRWLFIKHMLGNATLDTNKYYTKRTLPDQYFAYFSATTAKPKAFMVATSLEGVECLGKQKMITNGLEAGTKIGFTNYDIARVTIGYEAVTYDLLTDTEMGTSTEYDCKRFVTVFRQPTAEFLTLPQGAFKWVEFDNFGKSLVIPGTDIPCGTPVVGSNGKIISAQEVVVIHHKVPGIPKALNTHIGTVNDKEWPSLRAQRGQLLLANIELKPYKWLDNQRLYDITFKFKFFDPDPVATAAGIAISPELARGHNWFLQYFPNPDAATLLTNPLAGDPKYKQITHNGYPDYHKTKPGTPVYRYSDFKLLFSTYQETTSGSGLY